MAFAGRGGRGGGVVRGFDGKMSVMTQNRKAKDSETQRLHAKTFSAWANVHLRKRGVRVQDLEAQMADGLLLVALLEELSGTKCPSRLKQEPTLEIHKVENVALALAFLNQFVKVNVNPKDIVSGNLKVILSVLWRLIVSFQVSSSQEQEQQRSAVAAKREAKKRLMRWVSEKTQLPITNLDTCFQDGVAFGRLVAAYDSRLVDASSLRPGNARSNLEGAFRAAQSHMGIEPMLDVDDMLARDPSCRPDEQCVMTYLSHFPQAFLRREAPEPLLPSAVSLPDSLAIDTQAGSLAGDAGGEGQAGGASHAGGPGQAGGVGQAYGTQAGQELGAASDGASQPRYSLPSSGPAPPSMQHLSQAGAPPTPTPTHDPHALAEQPYGTQYASTQAPSAQAPSTQMLSTQMPGTQMPSTQMPGTEAPGGQPYASTQSSPYAEAASPYAQDANGQQAPHAQEAGMASMAGMAGSAYGQEAGQAYGAGAYGTAQDGSPHASQQAGQPQAAGGVYGSMAGNVPGSMGSMAGSMAGMGSVRPSRPPPPTSQFQPVEGLEAKEAELRAREEALRQQAEELRAVQQQQHEQQLALQQQQARILAEAQRYSVSDPRAIQIASENMALQEKLRDLEQRMVEQLTVGVEEARGIMSANLTGKSDPYVVITLDKQKEKTSACKRTVNPKWGNEFEFFVTEPSWVLSVVVYDKSKIRHDEFLGKVEVPINKLEVDKPLARWFTLQPKKQGGKVSGEIRLALHLRR